MYKAIKIYDSQDENLRDCILKRFMNQNPTAKYENTIFDEDGTIIIYKIFDL